MFNFQTKTAEECELHQFIAATSRRIHTQEQSVARLVGRLGRSTNKMDRQLQKIKQQLVREGSLTPE